jgi:hypothetical protein
MAVEKLILLVKGHEAIYDALRCEHQNRVRGSNPGGSEIFHICPERPWGQPSLLYNGCRVFPGVKSGRGVTLTPHHVLVPWS